MNYQELIRLLAPSYGVGEARAIVRMVMEDRFGLSQTDLLLGKDTTLSAIESKEFEKIAQRLINGEPVQYVLGYARFCGHCFAVSPHVLIPRPETEELTQVAMDDLRLMTEGSREQSPALKVLDLCTGSGCIAISLGLSFPKADVVGVDISGEALDIARLNASRLKVGNVRFFRGDVLDGAADVDGPVDLIISNPPYVMQTEAAQMSPHVLNHEPRLALFVPDDDALRFYRAIAEIGLCVLRPGGCVAVEINSALSVETFALFSRYGFADLSVHEDQFGRPRILHCVTPTS